jgi:hypothetical protein
MYGQQTISKKCSTIIIVASNISPLFNRDNYDFLRKVLIIISLGFRNNIPGLITPLIRWAGLMILIHSVHITYRDDN